MENKQYHCRHNWMLISEKPEFTETIQTFKCINCLLTYEKVVPNNNIKTKTIQNYTNF